MDPLFALGSAVLFGVWKFGIGRSKGAIDSNLVVLLSASTAAVGYLVLGLVSGGLVFNRVDMTRGVLGGAINLVGTLVLLKAFEFGALGVVAGVSAANKLVPLLWSFVQGDPISRTAAIGCAVVIAGLVVFFAPAMKRDVASLAVTRPLALALVAATLWGVAVVVIAGGTRVSTTATLFMSQLPQITFTAVMVAFVARRFEGLTRGSVGTLTGAGAALALGNASYFAVAKANGFGVASVLAATNPMVTALLAWALLGERMARSQIVALLLVVVGTGLVVV